MIDAEQIADHHTFHQSDPAYFALRLKIRLVWMAVFYLASAIAIAVTGVYLAGIAWAGVLVIRIITLILLRRRTYAFGYAETPTELVLRRGLLVRKYEVIPYGRLQKVAIEEGPLLRKEGLATVKLVTASAGTDGSIIGVRAEEAVRLRDTLSRLGEAHLEGL